MTIFYEGDRVEWVGGGFQAEGKIIQCEATAAHVKWESGPDIGRFTLVDFFDIEPVTAKVEDPFHLHAVRKAYDEDAEEGVVTFLAKNAYLKGWNKIAKDVLDYTEDRLRTDASMELVDEQLSAQEKQRVLTVAAMMLLRDAFGDPETE